ncbi:MAG TPA: type II toxin-antitoxin system HicA family toxin [Gammaproteobacteria bacterium]
MKSKHRKTLEAIRRKPTLANIAFADIEALIVALGGEARESQGSRVAFELGEGGRLYLHRPHPGKEAKKYQVEEIREWLESKGVKP